MVASREERNSDLIERAGLTRGAFGADKSQWDEICSSYEPESLRVEREAATIDKNAKRLAGLFGG